MKDFSEKVYNVCKRIPKGKVSTYGEIAKAIGNMHSSRAVGNVLSKNPFAPRVPCHRVIQSSGFVGGFAFGTIKKIALLRKEGIEISNGRIDLEKYLFKF